MLASWKKSYDQPKQHIKKQRRYFANKGPPSQSYGFSSSHVWMWELDYKESWVLKNWCFSTVVLEKTVFPLDCKEIQPVHPKGNQSLILIGRTDTETEAPILWPRDAKSWLIGKDPEAGKDWRQEEKGIKEDEIVGWHHQLDGHEFKQALGVGDGQGAWCAAVHGVTESWTGLTDWTDWWPAWACLVAQTVKNLPATQESWVRSLVSKISWRRAWLPCSLPAWRMPGTEEPGEIQSMESQSRTWLSN